MQRGVAVGFLGEIGNSGSGLSVSAFDQLPIGKVTVRKGHPDQGMVWLRTSAKPLQA